MAAIIHVWAQHNRLAGRVVNPVVWVLQPVAAVRGVRIHATLHAQQDASALQKRIHALLAVRDVSRTVAAHATTLQPPLDAMGVRPCAREVALQVAKGAEHHV